MGLKGQMVNMAGTGERSYRKGSGVAQMSKLADVEKSMLYQRTPSALNVLMTLWQPKEMSLKETMSILFVLIVFGKIATLFEYRRRWFSEVTSSWYS